MVSRYDIFLTIAANNGAIEESDMKMLLGVTDEKQFNSDLNFLISDKMIEKQQTRYVFLKNANSETLYDLLSFAITYDINYNNYFASPMLIFIEQAYLQKYFGIPEIQQVDEMKKINISILKKNGFLIVVSPRPFAGKIIQNSFLDGMLKINKRSLTPTDRKRKDINVESILVEKLMKKHLQAKFKTGPDPADVPEVKYLDQDDPVRNLYMNLTREQKAIKSRIAVINKEAFNTQFMENYKKAENLMTSNVRTKVRISKQVIIDYHKLLMNDPTIGGRIRTENVQIARNPHFKTSDFRKIDMFLDKLIARYQKTTFKSMPEVVKFGAFLHNELQFTHPFIDGNSRLTRLVMDHFFRENNAPIYEIPVAYISRYSAITKGARNRDDNKLFELLKEIFLYILCNQP